MLQAAYLRILKLFLLPDSTATLFPLQSTSRKLVFLHALPQGHDYDINTPDHLPESTQEY
jgi:hypothetical protein